MGILLVNIVSFALPSDVYGDPLVWGTDARVNLWTWATVFVLAEGKMRGLFSMLFGASLLLVADRAAAAGGRPARVHHARMAVLGAIGLLHGFLIWSGDILATYALCGAIGFAAWRWPVRRLLGVAAVLMVGQIAIGTTMHHFARTFEVRAAAPDASPALRGEWADFRRAITPSHAAAAQEAVVYRGGWRAIAPVRARTTWEDHATTLPFVVPETLAMMLVGMALLRSGFLSGAWPARRYRTVARAAIGVTLPLYALLAWRIAAGGFDPLAQTLTEPLHLVLLRPALAIGYAALVILWVRSDAAARLVRRIEAAGRMALSNYLACSIACTGLFYGYGLGWFGYLERWQLYLVVAAIWTAMLGWSQPWLDRFGQGPFEWLWRQLARHFA